MISCGNGGVNSLNMGCEVSRHLVKNIFYDYVFSPVGFKGNRFHNWTYFLNFPSGLKQMEV